MNACMEVYTNESLFIIYLPVGKPLWFSVSYSL